MTEADISSAFCKGLQQSGVDRRLSEEARLSQEARTEAALLFSVSALSPISRAGLVSSTPALGAYVLQHAVPTGEDG